MFVMLPTSGRDKMRMSIYDKKAGFMCELAKGRLFKSTKSKLLFRNIHTAMQTSAITNLQQRVIRKFTWVLD